MSATPVVSTTVRVTLRAFISAAVGSLIAWGVAKWGSFHAGTFAFLVPVASGLYYTVINWLEKKYPSLGWLLGTLPQPKGNPAPPAVTPTPAPTPAPAPAPAAGKKPTK